MAGSTGNQPPSLVSPKEGSLRSSVLETEVKTKCTYISYYKLQYHDNDRLLYTMVTNSPHISTSLPLTHAKAAVAPPLSSAQYSMQSFHPGGFDPQPCHLNTDLSPQCCVRRGVLEDGPGPRHCFYSAREHTLLLLIFHMPEMPRHPS